MYDAFSNDYDRFVNWTNRLAVELPFLQRQLKDAGCRRVLDSACGTGMHAIALAEAGFEAAGADFSAGMVERARLNAKAKGVSLRFEQAGFGEMEGTFGNESFDALLCLGNSLPHLLTGEQLVEALADFAACLKPGGLVILQNRNFDAVMACRTRWMEPQTAREGQEEWIFQRFYDFEPDGLITFNILSLHREGEGTWEQTVRSTQLRPLLKTEMQAVLEETGFSRISFYGDMNGTLFDETHSGNLVICARKA